MSRESKSNEFHTRNKLVKYPTPHFKSCRDCHFDCQCSITGVATSGSKALANSCSHRVHVPPEHLLRDLHPLLLQELEQLGSIDRWGVIVHHSTPKIVPQVFNGRQIGGSSWPIHPGDLLTLYLIPDHPGTVWSRVVVLQCCALAHGCQGRDDQRPQDLIPIPDSSQIAHDPVQGGSASLVEASPDHD